MCALSHVALGNLRQGDSSSKEETPGRKLIVRLRCTLFYARKFGTFLKLILLTSEKLFYHSFLHLAFKEDQTDRKLNISVKISRLG